jgi:predicted MFS family arabinose efflux permease
VSDETNFAREVEANFRWNFSVNLLDIAFIILEFCAPEDRPTYIGLTNTLLAPAKTLAPLIGGWLATWAGYHEMFVVALVVALLGGGLLTAWVREPRHIHQRSLAAAA